MFDVDKFIQCVQSNPGIWEKGTKDYTDRNLRESSWNVVGKNMFAKWPNMTEEEREDLVKQMKKKWRHIRDNYSKFINQGKGGRSTPKKKKYIYSQALSFLHQTVDKKRPSVTPPEVDDIENSAQGEDEGDNSEENVQDSVAETVSLKKRNARKLAACTSPVQSKLLDRLETFKTVEEDADKYFLLSLLPDLKKLNDEQKLDFRLHTLEFFRDIRRQSGPQTQS